MYTTYVDPEIIKKRLEGILNFGGGGNNSFTDKSGGVVIKDDELNQYQQEAESLCLRYLKTQYKIPLENKITGGTTLADFSDATAGLLRKFFVLSTMITIIETTSILQGARRNIELTGQRKLFDEILQMIMGKDQSFGIIIPAFEDLVQSHYYLTRQENPIPSVGNANTKYTDTLNRVISINATWCGSLRKKDANS